MPNYENSKIYKVEPIKAHASKDVYIGYTTQTYLCERLASHKSNYKRYKNGKYNNVTVFDLFDKYGVDNCKIELIENYPCKKKSELCAREKEYINNIACVNTSEKD